MDNKNIAPLMTTLDIAQRLEELRNAPPHMSRTVSHIIKENLIARFPTLIPAQITQYVDSHRPPGEYIGAFAMRMNDRVLAASIAATALELGTRTKLDISGVTPLATADLQAQMNTNMRLLGLDKN